jgi:alkylation response protein AidB-like acyl-CoA dehydrogenase
VPRPDRTPDQEFLAETTARYLASVAGTGALRALRDDPSGFRPDYWRQGCQMGWTSLLVSEGGGGGSVSGHGLIDLTLLAYEFGRHASPGPLGPAAVAAAALEGHDGGSLAGILAGTELATWAHEEAGPWGEITTVARRDGDEVVITGRKRPVESAGQSDWLLVSAVAEGDPALVLVPTDAPGVAVAPMRTVDLTRRFAAVDLDEVRVPAANVLSMPINRMLDQILVVQGAESVGAMQSAFDMTVEWAFDRYSFGRPLASYQALKHRFADMKAWLEGSHAIINAAADAVDAGAPDASVLVSAAKAFIGEYGSELMQECVQLHGGIGVTFDHDLHIFLRRVALNRMLFGTPADHRLRLGDDALSREGAR